MYTIIENLINHKFYKDVEEITFKLTLFTSYNMLTNEDYKKLMNLAISKYQIVKAEEIPIETVNTNIENKVEELKK